MLMEIKVRGKNLSNSNLSGITQKQLWLGLVPLISLSGITCLLLNSRSFAAIPEQIDVRIAQQPANSDAAQQVLQEALQLYQQGTAESLRQAIPKFEQAAILYRQAGDKRSEALSLVGLGRVYDLLGEKQTALAFYNQSLPLIQAVEDRGGEAVTLSNIGLIYDHLGEKQKALEFYDRALPLQYAVGDRAGEATNLTRIGNVYDLLGEKQKALEYYYRALPLHQVVGNRDGEATTLNNIGNVYNLLGEKQKALEYYNRALFLRRAVGDRGGEATALTGIGFAYSSLGEKQKSLEFLNQALLLSRAAGDRAGEASILANIGAVYDSLGAKQKALESYKQALPLLQLVGNRDGEAATLNNMGLVYYSLGEKQKALESYNQALPLLEVVGNRGGKAVILNNMGLVYYSLGEKQKALEFYNQALPLYQAVGDRAGEALNLNNIGVVYNSLGEQQKALESYNQSLPLSRAVGDRAGEALTISNFARLHRSQGNLKEALTLIENSITIIEDLRTKIDSKDLRTSYFATVQDYYEFYIDLLMQLHQQTPSRGYDALALHISERARARILLEQLTEASLDLKADLDPALAAEEKRLTQALNAADRKRIDLLKQYDNPKLEEVKAEIDDILNQLQNLEVQIRRANPAYANLKYPDPLTLNGIQTKILDDKTLLLQYALGKDRSYLFLVSKTALKTYKLPPKAEIEAAVEQYRELLQSPDFTDLSQGQQLSQMLLGQIAGELKEQRLVIVGNGKLQLLPFAALPAPVSSASTALKSLSQRWERDLGREQNARGITLFPQPLLPNLGEGEPEQPLKSLSQSWERDLGRGQNSQETVPLLKNHEIITLPSATSLAVQREQWQKREQAPQTLAVIADPVFKANDPRLGNNTTNASAGDLSQYEKLIRNSCGDFDRLPYTATEAEQILALVPNAQEFSALGFDANYATATNPNLSQYRIVHLATHGCIQDDPRRSNLALSFFNADGQEAENRSLKLQDIYNLKLNADLVVLSACQTGTGKEVQGEGIIGLTRGFMYAGARRVAVSLWSVNDRATSILMSDYYRKMLEQKVDPAAALQQAQLAMWQSDSYSAPYYWAAFTLQGDW
jgi:CHAT domain-containing protein/tetratricopeptide (TPR) repeat protein